MDIYGKADRFDHAVRGKMRLLFSFFCEENFPREKNASAAADFVNQTHPHKILNCTLEIPKHEPMYEPPAVRTAEQRIQGCRCCVTFLHTDKLILAGYDLCQFYLRSA